jgi:hypothetical protein
MSKFSVKEFEKFMGKKVRINGCFTRVTKHNDGKLIQYWTRVTSVFSKPGYTGWVIGVRWLQEGFIEYGCYDEPNHFVETGPRKLCYLVVEDPRCNPIKVPPSAIKVIE